jgi:hypothetical protein
MTKEVILMKPSKEDLKKLDSCLVECHIKMRPEEEISPLFTETEHGIICKLYRYAIIPREDLDSMEKRIEELENRLRVILGA